MSADVFALITGANHVREIHTGVALVTGGSLAGFTLSHQMRVVAAMATDAVWAHVNDAYDEQEARL